MSWINKLDRFALVAWPVLVAVIVGGSVYIVAARGWLTADVMTPVLTLALVLAYGLVTAMVPRRRRRVE
jgi:ABC-type proline/glycine betaine transport system permease subunit